MSVAKYKIPTVEDVRIDMRKELSAEDRQQYRGITKFGMTGTLYDRLYGIKTTEELILCQHDGAPGVPADDPTNMYFFSCGRGLTARYDPIYVEQRIKASGDREWHVCKETIDELDAIFRAKSAPFPPGKEEEAEELLNDVAARYIAWATKQFNWANSVSPSGCDCSRHSAPQSLRPEEEEKEKGGRSMPRDGDGDEMKE